MSQLQVLHAEYLDAASVLLFELVMFSQEVSYTITHFSYEQYISGTLIRALIQPCEISDLFL